MKKIAIIGAGWSGLACARALKQAEQRGGEASEVWLFEASPYAGGRARGITWETALGNTAIDNGQHLLLGAYSQTWQLLQDSGVLIHQAWSNAALQWASYSPNRSAPYSLLRVPPQAWPWRFLGQSFPNATNSAIAQPWSFLSRLSLANVLRHAMRSDWQVKGTALNWLKPIAMPEEVRQKFWRPLIEGALNTDWAEASAYVFLQVVKDSLCGLSGSTNCWHPSTDLSQSAIEPIVLWLKRHDTKVITRCRISAITPFVPPNNSSAERRLWQLQAHPSSQDQALALDLETQIFDMVVLATPAYEANRLWRQSKLQETPAIQRAGALDWRGVMTLYIHLNRAQAGLLAPMSQWLCSLPGLHGRAHIGLTRTPSQNGSQVVSLVASGLMKDDDRSILADSLWQAASHYLKPLGVGDLKSLPYRITDDPRATWACTAALTDGETFAKEASASSVACTLTGIDGLLRAADDLTPGYPACIEAAVRSGQACAQLIKGRQAPQKDALLQ